MLTRREALAISAASVLPAAIELPFAPYVRAADGDDPTKVYTGDAKPTDYRLGPPKTLNGYFPFNVPKTKEEWESRRKQLREQLLVANGLWPMPEKTPLNATIHSAIQRDKYTIEKVFFASTPGHYVSGNLYRPILPDASKPMKVPGVLFAHGHWANGRLHDAGEREAAASVKSGGEPDLDRGRYFMQAIPATLASMGFVVFQYDMVGVGDSKAIPHASGFADVEGELRLQSAMGLQTWNSIRSLDFLLSLPEVDPKRIGMTGASGGGTQTFILAALDDRLACAFPAVMVSTGMQGGCVCENCSLLRVNTGNVEIAAMFAPKPLALSAANDWTKEIMTKGYPELQALYSLYGARDKVAARAWLEYGHQYNVHSRQMMYEWFAKHLQGQELTVKEPVYKVVPPAELSVYDAGHPRPKDELPADRLRAVMAKASDAQMAKLAPKDAASLKEFKDVVGTALRAMVNDGWKDFQLVGGGGGKGGKGGRSGKGGDEVSILGGIIGRPEEMDGVPYISISKMAKTPVTGDKAITPIIWLDPRGKSALFVNQRLIPAARTLVEAGFGIIVPDLLGVGEKAFARPLVVDKKYAGYTNGYNRTLIANRLHDVLTMVKHVTLLNGMFRGERVVKSSDIKPAPVYLLGVGEFGPVAILAKALAGDAVAKTAADLNQFRFDAIKDTADPMLLPGAVKYGGMGAFLALCAPGEVLVHNHRGTGIGQLSKAAYEAAGAANKLTTSGDKLDDAKVVEWLVKG